MIIIAGTYISLDSIDAFWRKLDLNPSTCMQGNDTNKDDDDADDAYIDEGLDDFKRVFKSEPKPVRKNMYRRLMDIIKPSKTQIKEPAVVKNKRGRPSVQKKPSKILPDLNKTPLTKGSPILEKSRSMHSYGAGPRTSMSNYPESQRAPARQSSYMPSVSRFSQEDYSGTSSHFPDPSFHTSHSPDPSFHASIFPELFGEQGTQFMYGTPESRFEIPLSEIPKVFHQYVRRIVNVKGDGNCGFRALAVALGYDDKDSIGLEWVRNEMLAEYDTNKDFYDSVFAVERVHKSVQMSYPDGGRPRDYWMSMPEGPILLANRLGLVINCLSLDESSTVFPFWRGPDSEMYRNQPISIAIVHGGIHYVMVELEGKYPMARLNPYWSPQNITPGAARWKDHFKDQFDLYVRLTNGPFT